MAALVKPVLFANFVLFTHFFHLPQPQLPHFLGTLRTYFIVLQNK